VEFLELSRAHGDIDFAKGASVAREGRARWLSFEELEKERTFPDVLVTARKILDEMKSTSGPAA